MRFIFTKFLSYETPVLFPIVKFVIEMLVHLLDLILPNPLSAVIPKSLLPP